MQSMGKDGPRSTEIDTGHDINSVFFAEDGKQLLSGGTQCVLRRWQIDDGQEAGEPIPVEHAEIFSAALSPDRRWFVCGLRPLTRKSEDIYVKVWDAKTHAKVLDIKGHDNTVFSVDISPDSTKLATGGGDDLVFIWNMMTGEKLVGPLQHEGTVVAVRFSPTGERIATATAENPDAKSIRIYASDTGQLLLDIPFHCMECTSSWIAWSDDSRQLFAAASSEVKRFDTSSGSLVSKWSVPGGGQSASVVLSRNQKFMVVVAWKSISFWDTSTQEQIGTSIDRTSTVWSLALSPNDDYFAIGEDNGKVAFMSLHNILPVSYLTVNVIGQLPFMYIGDTVFKLWTLGNLTRVEELLTEEIAHPNSFHRAQALAQRALVRAQSKFGLAIDDAKKSAETHRSVVGYIAMAITHVHNGEHDSALRVFDLVFSVCRPSENSYLLLIKAVILFTCGKHDDALLRIDDLIDIVEDQSLLRAVRAQMLFLIGSLSMNAGDHKHATELLKRAQEAIPFRQSPYLDVISLIFGWDFAKLPASIQIQLYKAMDVVGDGEGSRSHSIMVESLGNALLMGDANIGWDPDVVQKFLATCESNGDAAMESHNLQDAILQYSTALSLNPSNPVDLLVKRSRARAMLGLLEDALKDADEAIKTNPLHPWGYERRHAVLHASQRYDEAIDAFSRMYSLIEASPDQDIRQQGKRYISPTRSEMAIASIVQGIFKTCPLVLIDVNSGRLCDGLERMRMFKLQMEFKELHSSLTEGLDEERIQQVVERYFQYVSLSHVWEGEEPLFQDVNLAGSVWKLDSSPLNEKLRQFCEVVREDGYHWAWSDTCCIDKTISTVLNQSLTMMYKWYRASVATYVHLAGVGSPSILGDLTGSIWMTRAWTAQELLAARVIRFYTRDWKPYLGDTRRNHKESPEIMQELASCIRISHETILAFNPDDITIREKLRLASKRNAKLEEDVAYSLIGIFKSDIVPRYGEGEAALGHLLEEIVTRTGEVTVFAWNGTSSSYNSCLPSSLSPYAQPPSTVTAIEEEEMDTHVTTLRNTLPQSVAMSVHDRVTRLSPARFLNRRLYLPCIIFTFRKLGLQSSGSDEDRGYRARVSGIGYVEFRTSARLSLTEPRKYVLVHPWIRDLRDPLNGVTWRQTSYDEYDSDVETDFGSAPTSPVQAQSGTAVVMDDYTRALRLIARLQQPFHALLLQQQPNGEFKRVATDCDIVVPGVDRSVTLARDIHTEVLEIL